MKVKNILVTVACVLGFGGIIANTTVGIVNNNKLKEEISTVKSDLEVADAQNKAELVALVETTRDQLKAAYEEADVSLQNGLNAAKAALEAADAKLAADMSAADQAIANNVAAKVAELTQQISQLSAAAVAGQQGLQDEIDVLADALAEVSEQVQSIATVAVQFVTVMNSALQDLQDVVAVVAGLNNTVGSLNTALQGVIENLEANYYTVSEVNGIVAGVYDAIGSVRDLFRDAQGEIVSMKKVLETIDTLFTGLKERIDQHDLDIADLQAGVQDLNKKFDDFYGDDAKEAKAQYIVDLYGEILDLPDDVKDLYAEIVNLYAPEEVPADVTTLKDNILAKLDEVSMKVFYRANLYITLAKDKDQAKNEYIEASGKLDAILDALRLVKAKKVAHDTVFKDLVTKYETPKYRNYDATIADDYAAQVAAVVYDDSILLTGTLAEIQAYYAGLIDDIDAIVYEATTYHDVIVYAHDVIKGMDDFAAAPYHLSKVKVQKFADIIAEFDAHSAFIAKKTELADDDDAAEADLEASMDFIKYMLKQYDFIEAQRQLSEDIIGGTREQLEDVTDTIISDLEKYASVDTFIANARAKADNANTDVAEQDVKKIADKAIANSEYVARVAAALKDLVVYKNSMVTELGNIDADDSVMGLKEAGLPKNKVYTDAFEGLVPNLAEIYQATGKDSADMFEEQDKFDAYVKDITDEMDAILEIAKLDDLMLHNFNKSIVSARDYVFNNVELGINEKLYAMVVICENVDEYCPVQNKGGSGFKFVVEGATYAEKLVKTQENYIQMITELDVIDRTLDKIDAALTASKVLNAKIAQKLDTFENSFKTGFNNWEHDGDTVYTNHSAAIAALEAQYNSAYGDDWKLPITADKDYATLYTELVAFQAELDAIVDTVCDDNYEALSAALDVEREGMIAEYNLLEEAYLARRLAWLIGSDGLAGADTQLGKLYAAAKTAAAGDATKLGKLAAVYDDYKMIFTTATSSMQLESMYLDGCVVEMEKILTGSSTVTVLAAFAVLEAVPANPAPIV